MAATATTSHSPCIRPPPHVAVENARGLFDRVDSIRTLLQEHGYVLLSGLKDMTATEMKQFFEALAPNLYMIPFNDSATIEVTAAKQAPPCIPDVPEIRVLGRGHANALLANIGYEWHQDGGGTAPFWTLLHCKQACPGADTLFADGQVLFQRLSQQNQELARSLTAVYSNQHTAGGPAVLDAAYGVRMSDFGTKRIASATKRKQDWREGRFEKPIVQVAVDDSGKEALLAGAKNLDYIQGYDAKESRELLSSLLRSVLLDDEQENSEESTRRDVNEETTATITRSTTSQFSPKTEWQDGQAILFDNDRVLHSTTPLSSYAEGKSRLMWQIIAKPSLPSKEETQRSFKSL